MKKICFLIFVFLCFQYGRSATTAPLPIEVPLKLKNCLNISVGQFEKMRGKKLNLFERASFAFVKGRMKNALRKDKDMTIDQFLISKKKKRTPMGAGVIIFVILGLIAVIALLLFHRSYDP